MSLDNEKKDRFLALQEEIGRLEREHREKAKKMREYELKSKDQLNMLPIFSKSKITWLEFNYEYDLIQENRTRHNSFSKAIKHSLMNFVSRGVLKLSFDNFEIVYGFYGKDTSDWSNSMDILLIKKLPDLNLDFQSGIIKMENGSYGFPIINNDMEPSKDYFTNLIKLVLCLKVPIKDVVEGLFAITECIINSPSDYTRDGEELYQILFEIFKRN